MLCEVILRYAQDDKETLSVTRNTHGDTDKAILKEPGQHERRKKGKGKNRMYNDVLIIEI